MNLLSRTARTLIDFKEDMTSRTYRELLVIATAAAGRGLEPVAR